MAALASRTRPSGQAIEVLFDHMGRLVTYAGTAVAVLAGQWVAGLVAAWILGADRWPEARWADLEAQLRVSKQDETEPGSGTPAPAPKRTGPLRRTVRSSCMA